MSANVFNGDSQVICYTDKHGDRRVQVVADDQQLGTVLGHIEADGGKWGRVRTFASYSPWMTERLIGIFNLLWVMDEVSDNPSGPWQAIGEDLLTMDVTEE